jgi:hypothetical protein
MVTVGPEGLLNIIVVFFVMIVIPVWLTLFMKKKLPNKLPAGLALSFFFPLIGHLYLDGAARYILMLFIIALVTKKAAGDLSIWLIISLISAITMYIRFKKLAPSADLKETEEKNRNGLQSPS